MLDHSSLKVLKFASVPMLRDSDCTPSTDHDVINAFKMAWVKSESVAMSYKTLLAIFIV